MKIRRVRGEARISFTVELPGETARQKVTEDDPAEEIVLKAITRPRDIYLWGPYHKPAIVVFGMLLEDIDIEEDKDINFEED